LRQRRSSSTGSTPTVELRAISNDADEADRSLWRHDDAFAALQDAVPRFLAALE
jgi:hypothetical protein